MTSIAIITARGGSKRIPGKNIRPFCGRPIIAYSIEAAKNAGIFSRVMVSTDSQEIADIAVKYGAEVPFMRSEHTSNDYAVTEDVLIEVLQRYTDKGETFDILCCLYPTAPFITSDRLKKAYSLLVSDRTVQSVIPVVEFSFPPQRAVVIDDGFLRFKYPEYRTSRSQDLEPQYHDAGQFYMCTTESMEKYHDVLTPCTIPMILPEQEVQDIDNESDWIIAEEKYKAMMKESYK